MKVELFSLGYYLLMAASFLVTFFIVPRIVKFAKRYKITYNPNYRSSHNTPIPAFGGIAFFIGFMFYFILVKTDLPGLSTILVSCSLMFLTGFVDDLIGLKPVSKLIITLLISVLVVLPGDLIITNLHGFFSIFELNTFFAYSITILVIVFVIHAINLIDGVDGLASGIGITALSIFSFCFYRSGYFQYLSLTLPMVFSLLAFLGFNIWGKRFKIFMGDSGSLLVGLVLALTLILYMQIPSGEIVSYMKISPVSVFALLIIPVVDTIHVSIKRLLNRQSPFTPDRKHIHHTYLKLGLSHRMTTLILIVYTLMFFMLSQFLLNYMRGYLTLIILVIIALFVWNVPEYVIMKNPRKFALRRYNYIVKSR
jgi:UDP-GlcNAc:undecaprenyl-phosphate/decaprenyl-phosphate GlcNAc-1-phosphate transferase